MKLMSKSSLLSIAQTAQDNSLLERSRYLGLFFVQMIKFYLKLSPDVLF